MKATKASLDWNGAAIVARVGLSNLPIAIQSVLVMSFMAATWA